jgi:hypothetical protein
MPLSDYIKSILFLAFFAIIFSIIGFAALLKPSKVREVYFKMMTFYRKMGISYFYKERMRIMSSDFFLLYLRFLGAIFLFAGALLVYLLIRRVREGHL